MSGSETRTHLLDAAEQVVREHGIDGFSYADLSRDVGIRKASIHYHFPAKADLLAALMARYRERVMDELDRITAASTTPARAITGFLDLYREALSEGSSLCLCVAYAINTNRLDQRVLSEIRQFRDEVMSWLEERFSAGAQDGSVPSVLDKQQEAAAALALAEGGQIAARLQGQLVFYDKAVEVLYRRLSPG